MILEGLATTRNPDENVNVAPMGPIVQGDFAALHFRPFPGSVTCDNLHRTRCGVFHVVDDVLLLVQTALDLPHDPPGFQPAQRVDGAILEQCCRWYEFRIESIDTTGERPLMVARVVHQGRNRDSWGFNRARHAVLEATIAATRLHLLPAAEIDAELERCRVRVQKTGGERERLACELVCDYVHTQRVQGREASHRPEPPAIQR